MTQANRYRMPFLLSAEEAAPRGLAFNAMGATAANMGVAFADIDGDGWTLPLAIAFRNGDRGVLVVCDSRLATATYRRSFLESLAVEPEHETGNHSEPVAIDVPQ